jgi:hypothetical protein
MRDYQSSAPSSAAPLLIVEHTRTPDDELGPNPPPGGGWQAVSTTNKATVWRRIRLAG